ncbi:Very-long-chain 3-oxoacyl-CoA reductase [Grifola frondosa]|uniref:Very-long-chain 3-oxoacyl-CoA reductase n=1 Tax=Grifola frondosa TaxID=5627 RepID=A0A1C7LR65_GRIFR|nr:Very-long-chain 3-oxoacyl-CoA reductase [Grifola frondosa]
MSWLKKYGAGKGAWAGVVHATNSTGYESSLVTGASEGIGREFALQLAQKGFNVLVSARNASALATLLAEIGRFPQYDCVGFVNITHGKAEMKSPRDNKVQAKAVTMDFSKVDDAAQWKRFEAELEGLDIGVLVNNVGKSYTYPMDFADAPVQDMEDILAINVTATTRVTKLILPGMVQRKRGLIVSLGSFSGVSIASPMLATYAGSKSYLASFSACLAEEVKSKGIDVETLNTYFVVSNMSKIRRASAFIPTPKAYVKTALSKARWPSVRCVVDRPPARHYSILEPRPAGLGHVRDADMGCPQNAIGWNAAYIYYTHELHRDIQRRALRKLEREAKKQ